MVDPEIYVQAAVDQLRARLSAAVDAENALHTDFQIPKPLDENGLFDPSRVLFGGETETTALLSYPSVVVAVPDETSTDFDIDQSAWDSAMTLVVAAYLEQTDVIVDYPTLYRATLRYGRVLRKILFTKNAINNASVQMARQSYVVDPRLTQSGSRIGQTTVILSLEDKETYG